MSIISEHEQCGRCGRKLKTEKSRKDGFGRVCKRKWEVEKIMNESVDPDIFMNGELEGEGENNE
jgi:hypothetical protein